MEAKDTVMKDEDKMAMSDIKNRWLHSLGKKDTFEHDCIDEIINTQRQIQAEISFKVGEDKGYAHARQHCEDVIIPQAKQEGIREVVEWLHDWHRDVEKMVEFQAKLEEWGI